MITKLNSPDQTTLRQMVDKKVNTNSVIISDKSINTESINFIREISIQTDSTPLREISTQTESMIPLRETSTQTITPVLETVVKNVGDITPITPLTPTLEIAIKTIESLPSISGPATVPLEKYVQAVEKYNNAYKTIELLSNTSTLANVFADMH
jgi:hypothetical protein